MDGQGENHPFLEPKGTKANCFFLYRPSRSGWVRIATISLLLNTAFLFIILPAVVWAVLIYSAPHCLPPADGYRNGQSFKTDTNLVASYSSVLDRIHIDTHYLKFNGRIHDNTSIYRLNPSPEVDAAWDRLTAEGHEIITVNQEDVLISGKAPELAIKAPLSWGRGTEAYIAQIDVFHQIHCLNELRKNIHFDYYYGSRIELNTASLPPKRTEHIQHCIHIILQNLMCHADVNIITHNWVHYDIKDQPNRPFAEPLADFNLIKKCHNFDALLNWTHGNAVQNLAQKWTELKMPQNATFVHGDGYF